MNKFKYFLILLSILFFGISCAFFAPSTTVRADEDEGYTQEEIEAAKAWLSAHGYPPTRAGAEQAYQDYLDGKLDDDPDVKAYRGEDDDDEEDDDEKEDGNNEDTGDTSNPSGENTDTNVTNEDGSSTKNQSSVNTATDAKSQKSQADIEKEKLENKTKELESDLKSASSDMVLSEYQAPVLSYEETPEKTNRNTFIFVIAGIAFVIILISVIVLLR